ncbi:MAG TPA: hypothetical protein VM141_07900 [Planctomycetota bacterium]|nr:hypothetical protein [Planctomycetota bacterium]
MKFRHFCLLALIAFARYAEGAQETNADTLYNDAWYAEEGLRDPEKAVLLYKEVHAKFPASKDVALKSLTRAAECYRKLGNPAEEARVWEMAWKDYKEQIENSDEYQHEAIRIRTAIDKALAGAQGIDMAEAFNRILDQMPPQQLRPVRDSVLLQAAQQRQTNWFGAISSLKFAILLSVKLQDEVTAAKAQSEIGEIQLEQEDYFGAIEAFHEAQSYRKQRTVLAWNQMRMAEAYRLSYMTDMAISTYDDLFRAYPEQIEQVLWAKLWAADCYRELGQEKAASDILKEIAESTEAKNHPRQALMARILAGIEKPPAEFNPAAKDSFTNDEFYFIANRFKADGDLHKAVQFWKSSIEASVGKDWPYQMARQALYLNEASVKSGKE